MRIGEPIPQIRLSPHDHPYLDPLMSMLDEKQ